jgi:hypothetical protein
MTMDHSAPTLLTFWLGYDIRPLALVRSSDAEVCGSESKAACTPSPTSAEEGGFGETWLAQASRKLTKKQREYSSATSRPARPTSPARLRGRIAWRPGRLNGGLLARRHEVQREHQTVPRRALGGRHHDMLRSEGLWPSGAFNIPSSAR